MAEKFFGDEPKNDTGLNEEMKKTNKRQV